MLDQSGNATKMVKSNCDEGRREETTRNENDKIKLGKDLFDSGDDEESPKTNCCTCYHKYANSLKQLLPFRSAPKNPSALPIGSSGCFSFASLGWLSSLMWNAYRHGIDRDNLWKLAPQDTAQVNSQRLESIWNQELMNRGDKASFKRAVWTFIRTRTLVAMVLVTIYSVINVVTPAWIFKLLVNYVETRNTSLQDGLFIVATLAALQLIRIASFSASWIFSAHTAMRVQGAIKLFLFRKALRVRHRGDKLVSQVINDITVETDRVFEATSRGISSFSTVVVAVFIVIYSTLTIGYWAWLGVAVLACAFPLTSYFAKTSAQIRRRAMPYTQERIHLTNEVLTNIRLIKMYAWENSFQSKVSRVRDSERKILQRSAFVHSVSQTTAPVICIIAACATFLGHTLSGNSLSAAQAFSIFSVFAAARFSLSTTTNNTKLVADAFISCGRIQKLLLLGEAENPTDTGITNEAEAIIMRSATFSWKDTAPKVPPEGFLNLGFTDEKPLGEVVDNNGAMKNVNLTINKGTLVGVCGSVGSGKSSLLAAIFGDMALTEGQLGVRGEIAYVPQQTWVHSGTLKENILFGTPLEANRYEAVLETCCLEADIKLLPNADETELGERGVNLSGGQRQRINLARALYSNRDIYLLDDPLSAVDTRVAEYIFQRAIVGLMYGKTVLLVTHGMNFLKRCNSVLVMDNGVIVEQGTPKQLIMKQGRYKQMFDLLHTNETPEMARRRSSISEVMDFCSGEPPKKKKESKPILPEYDPEKGRLVQPEEVQQGTVTLRTYIEYVKAAGGWCVAIIVLMVFLLHLGSNLLNSIWLQRWIDDGDGYKGSPFHRKLIRLENSSRPFHLKSPENTTVYQPFKKVHTNIVDNPLLWMYALVYGISVILLVLTGLLQSFFSTLVALFASSNLHNNMFTRILRSPMAFFDTTPAGRILNRFSKDMDELDYTFPFQLGYVLMYLLAMFGQMALIGVVYPWSCIALAVILVVIFVLDTWLHVGVRETKRLESVCRSSVVVHVTSALQGLGIIRVFKKESLFTEKFEKYVNEHQMANILFYCTILWFAFRMEIICSILITTTGLLVVFNAESTSAALAGLALSSAFQVMQTMTGLTRNKTDLQARFTSVERIVEYGKTIPQESSENDKTQPLPGWPADGSVNFKNVCLRYRPGLPPVLNGLTWHVKGGEKIGIIGRTGAGKSSSISALLRLVEVDSGTITIDGIDIKTLSLQRLRSVISVIPQDPVLFQGTIRYNLDPFSEHTDEDIWDALAKSYLKDKITKEAMQLEAVVDADGDNFSLGEKQLVCLARTILRKNKILLLDEATAFVDIETDHKIQQTIQESFADCTVLTVAHRLNTIWDSDRILVIDNGMVAEFDAPEILMKQKTSTFRELMLAMGVNKLHRSAKRLYSTTISIEE